MALLGKSLTHDRKIQKLERQIFKDKQKLASLRKKTKLVEIPDYELLDKNGKVSRLSALFGKKDELLLIHNMGTACPYCTLWADGFNGWLDHLQDRAAFAVESPNLPKVQQRFAQSRGWKFTMVSSHDSKFRRDVGFASAEGDPTPGASTFKKKNGKVYLASQTVFGPGDNFCSVFDLFELLPRGINNWQAQFKY